MNSPTQSEVQVACIRLDMNIRQRPLARVALVNVFTLARARPSDNMTGE